MITFGGIPEEYAIKEKAAVLLQSIPYDGTSTWGKGADSGFQAFIEAAANMELYDIETSSEVYKAGIHLMPEMNVFKSPEDMFSKVYSNTKELLQEEKFLTFFGGEHSISIGIIKAHYEHFNQLSILQLDAHTDLRPTYGGTPYNHACALFDANKNAHLIQVGIRSMDASENEYLNPERCYFAHQIHLHSLWMEECISKLNENVYITFDLDALDPSILPATGTPEPGGLDWYTTTSFLKKVFASRNVVGFDIVELAPIEGHTASQFLAAKLYYKMLSYKFVQ
ncbi:MAG TPA: agmatinase [Saprospiraceae bacterium]|nr:agmatinase [Saprospiraceae bacterium]